MKRSNLDCPVCTCTVSVDPQVVASRSGGFTLIELVLVIAVLVILAGLVVPLLTDLRIATFDGEKTPEEIATEQTMRQIRDAIMGTSQQPGMWPDLGHRPEYFPLHPNVLLLETAPAELPTNLQAFDPVTGLGWRGPYLAGLSSLIDAWGNPLVIQVNFDGSVGVSGHPTIDASEARYARLVSAGPDGAIDTPPDVMDPRLLPGPDDPEYDDLVLFFRVADMRPREE